MRKILRLREPLGSKEVRKEYYNRMLENYPKSTNIAFIQKKWKKNITFSNIQILYQTYTLKATDNKRELIYNK
jgi:hypothetical protein